MLYVGVSRVRCIDNVFVVANVNRFNSNADARDILMRNPDLTSVDDCVRVFMKRVKEAEARRDVDSFFLEELREKHPRSDKPATHAGIECALCGGDPTLVTLPCGHLSSCQACWDAAVYAGVRTCMRCGSLVTSTARVCL